MTDPGLTYLLARASFVENRVRALIDHRRQDDPTPDDPFRGLYLSDEAILRLLTSPEGTVTPDDRAAREAAEASAASAGSVRLKDLANDAGLDDLDVELLVIALMPDLDSRFERLYGYLNDDVTRRRASVGLALEIADQPVAAASARARLARGRPLVDLGLLLVEDIDRPVLSRSLRVPDRVLGHLLGDDTPDPALLSVTADFEPYDCDLAGDVAAALEAGVRLVHLREPSTRTGRSVGSAALMRSGRQAIGLDLARLGEAGGAADLVLVAGREALLRGAGIVAGPVEALASSAPAALRDLASQRVPVLLVGETTWDPTWSRELPLLVQVPALTSTERAELWRTYLAGSEPQIDPLRATAHFVLGPDDVDRAVRGAKMAQILSGLPLTTDDLRRGARAQNAAGLERLARRVEPAVGWSDLVLPVGVLRQLQDLGTRARHRDLVLTEWRMRPGGGRGIGITALFAGDSGTGKTMSAEVIANDLGLDLYTVDLATVVDKYVGETEKNLERIFREASGVNAVLLFDEADAIFGKRSEVRDAHDRYANIESAYLLQRMESFDGLAILATNLRANIDDAFTRRLDAIIDFSIPNEELRLGLWTRCLAAPLPTASDLDLPYVARSFELSGGSIRAAAVTAAYLAAERAEPVGMQQLVIALQQEYRKLGRLVLEREFGPYMPLLR